MPITIPPKILPIAYPRRRPLRLPLQLDTSCVLCLMPQRGQYWHDHSRFGNHGAIHGATWTSAGRFGPALSFDGVNDYVDCGNAPSTDIVGSITVEAWINLQTLNKWQTLVARRPALHDIQYDMAIMNNNRLYMSISKPTWAPIIASNTILTTGVWYHGVITYDEVADLWKLYLNGNLDKTATDTQGPISQITTLKIGWAVGPEFFNGLIDEVRIYNRALTAWEIATLYEWGRG